MTESVTRLHISPLTPALLDSVLNPSIRPLATDISFHNIATFPENDYGFVTLPTMEADKLKKKLNGSILKGKKFRVEAAREDPKKKKATKIENDASPKPTETSSKRKAGDAEDSVFDGYELPAGRHVKRGWTEPASAKRLKKQKKAGKEASETKLQPRSKYTEKAECLFKTKVPPNKMSEAASKKAKSKKSNAPNEVVIHEFAKTYTHPSFLKSSVGGKPITAKFEEGKGWMDEEGNVLEETSSKMSKSSDYHPGKKDGAKERPVIKEKSRKLAVKERTKSSSPDAASSSEVEDEELDWTSSSGSSESESSESDNDSDSESDDSSSSDAPSISDREEKVTKTMQATTKSKSTKNDEQEDEGDSTSESDSDQEDSSEVNSEVKPSASSEPVETTTEDKEVHPLEALFKRTQAEKNVSEAPEPTFSFFAENDDDIEDEEEEAAPVPLEPLTPFSKQDRQIRNLRSGAPTPDTAVFNRRKLLLEGDGDDDEDEDMDTDDDYDHAPSLAQETPSKQTTSQRQPEESDFVKWFWENRGDNNRAWKRRRREAAKEKRQRENRRKGLKGRG